MWNGVGIIKDLFYFQHCEGFNYLILVIPTFYGILGTLVVLAVAFLTPYFYYITKSSLAAVIIAAVISMIEYHVVLPMWRTNSEYFYLFYSVFLFFNIVGLNNKNINDES